MKSTAQVNRMHKFAVGLALLATLALAACNDSSDFAGSPSGTGTGTGTPTAVSAVKVSSSSATIPADSSSGATVQALVLGAGNVAISGATVSFAATSGALENVTATTNSSGIATATLLADRHRRGLADNGVGRSGRRDRQRQRRRGQQSADHHAADESASSCLPIDRRPLPSRPSCATHRISSSRMPTVNFSATSGAIVPVQTTAGAAANPVGASGHDRRQWPGTGDLEHPRRPLEPQHHGHRERRLHHEHARRGSGGHHALIDWAAEPHPGGRRIILGVAH